MTYQDKLDAVQALRELMGYVGGWDSPLDHPCGKAAAVLKRIDKGKPRLAIPYETKMELLRDFADLQGEMAAKYRNYTLMGHPSEAMRFSRASYAAINARTFMQAALMAERELLARAEIGQDDAAA